MGLKAIRNLIKVLTALLVEIRPRWDWKDISLAKFFTPPAQLSWNQTKMGLKDLWGKIGGSVRVSWNQTKMGLKGSFSETGKVGHTWLKSDQDGIESTSTYMDNITKEQVVEIRPRWDWKCFSAPPRAFRNGGLKSDQDGIERSLWKNWG